MGGNIQFDCVSDFSCPLPCTISLIFFVADDFGVSYLCFFLFFSSYILFCLRWILWFRFSRPLAVESMCGLHFTC
jgi:hypothetical protein